MAGSHKDAPQIAPPYCQTTKVGKARCQQSPQNSPAEVGPYPYGTANGVDPVGPTTAQQSPATITPGQGGQSPQAKGELVRWDQQAPNNHAQQSPQAKGELVRWGQQPPNARPQRLPKAKGELRRWGQQLPNNYLQQLPQAKGELLGNCWESVIGKISEESSLETRVEQLPGNSPLAWGNCWG